jgi:hypothetical protein
MLLRYLCMPFALFNLNLACGYQSLVILDVGTLPIPFLMGDGSSLVLENSSAMINTCKDILLPQ